MIIDFTTATLATAGGKGANLGELTQAGFPVPDGFVIAADTYRAATAALDLPALLAQGGADGVRAAVEAQSVPDSLARQIAERLALWGDGAAVAVRSSATAEDLPDASFAGQQDTFLGIVGADAVVDAVRRCWGSLWTARAVDYRERAGYDHSDVALAVVVQRLVDADVAGVLFTRNPVTGADECTIDASWGLGESVVSGAVTPDEYRATPATVLERTAGDKQTRIDRNGAATVTTHTPDADRARLCLADEQVLTLARLGAQVEDHFGQPMDIEWAYEGQTLWLLQARPITTTVTPPATAPERTAGGRRIGKASRAFHTDLVEHYPGPAPLDLAAIIPMHRQLQAGMASIGITSTPIDQLLHMDADGTITAAYPDVHLGWRLARLVHYPAPDPTGWPQVEARYRQRLATVLPDALIPQSDASLFGLLDDVLSVVDDIARTRFLDYVGPAQLVAARLDGYLALARRRDLDAYSLLGDLDYTTVVIDHALHDLASLNPTTDTYTEARQNFLDQYGARTTQLYLPFSHRSWREDPAALDATLDAIRRAPQRPDTSTSHAELVDQITAALPRPVRARFRRAVQRWRAGHVAREASVHLIEQAYLQARRVTDEMARRLHDTGALDDPAHIQYLSLDDIRAALLHGTDRAATRDLAQHRAEARPRAAAAWWATESATADAALNGAAGSPGIASGPVRIITGPEDFDRLQPGDVLVCRYTDPSWTPLFSLASAVVADTGGRLSHAAIVAREYAIPAVMGTHHATTTLADGQRVTVNGTTGTITTEPTGR
ncbi:hypothetical protein GCM10027030_02330 [Luteococcus sediminum]